jgi:hypothetical protein
VRRCARYFAVRGSHHPERGERTSIEAGGREGRLRG